MDGAQMLTSSHWEEWAWLWELLTKALAGET